MDPANPLRGPRRARLRGEPAVRYDRFSSPDGGAGAAARFDTLVRQRVQEEAWADAEEEEGEEEDELVDETSSGEDFGGGGRLGGGEAEDEDEGEVEDEGEGEVEDEGEGEDEDEDDHNGDPDDGDPDDDDPDPDPDDGDPDFDFESHADLRNEEEALISFDPMLLGLKEINNLAHFSVSSHKPGNGVEELLSDDLSKFWQSDGPQPHLLTIHFLRRVEIRAIRFYVDYNQDESYTPTSVVLSAGTGPHDLLEFASLALVNPVGWQEIDLSGVGGGADGQSLCCWIVQVKVRENHQNGKDTHVRGIKLYAIDENAPPADSALDELARVRERTLERIKDEPVDRDDYLFERIIAQSPDRLPGAPERSGSMAKFLRDMEIR